MADIIHGVAKAILSSLARANSAHVARSMACDRTFTTSGQPRFTPPQAAFALAICHVATAQDPASAQSFQASPTVVSGSAQVSTAPGTTTVNVSSPRTIIDWAVADQPSGPLAFQSAGTSASFIADQGLGNGYAVLNRILATDPSRPARFDGEVRAFYQTSTGLRTGGTILFYNPGGILVGPAASFDVGSLVLTSANPSISANGDFLATNALGETNLHVTGADPASRIAIEAGANIRTTGYVAIVAPAISNAGTISLGNSGSNAAGAALVAAESARLVFRPSGLFDIEVELGTSAGGTVIANSGAIVGSASSSANRSNRIYLVALSRNAAVSMAFSAGSRLGFDVAATAKQDGNAVILSGGTAVHNGTIDTSGATANAASLAISDTAFLSGLDAGALQDLALTGDVTTVGSLNAVTAGTFSSAGTLATTGNLAVTAGAIAVGTVSSSQDLSLRATGSIDILSATSGGDLVLDSASGNISARSLAATGDFANDTTGADLAISALSGRIALGSASAGDDIVIRAGATGITAAALTTTGRRTDAERTQISVVTQGHLALGEATSLASIALSGDTLEAGSVIAAEDIFLSARRDMALGSARAGDDLLLSAGGTLRADTLSTTGIGPDDRSFVQEPDGALRFTSSNAERANLLAVAGGDLFLGQASSRASLVVRGGALTASSLVSGEDLLVTLSGNGTIAVLQSADDLVIRSAGTLALGTVRTTGIGPDDRSITLEAAPSFSGETLERANVLIEAANALSATTVTARGTIGASGLSVSGDNWSAGEDLVVRTRTGIALGSLVAADDIVLSSDGPISARRLETTGIGPDTRKLLGTADAEAFLTVPGDRANIIVDSLSDIQLGTTSARASLVIRGTDLSGETWSAGEDLVVQARRSISLGALVAGDDLVVQAGQSVVAGTVTALGVRENDRSVVLGVTGPIAFARETASSPVLQTDFSALSRSGFSATGVSPATTGTVTLIAGEGLVTRDIAANSGIAILGGGSIRTGNVASTAGAVSIGAAGSSLDLGNVDTATGALAVVSGGALATGILTASSVLLDADGPIMANAVSAAERIVASSTDKIAIAAPWRAPSISLSANDLALATSPAAATLDAGPGGRIEITALSPSPLLLGNAAGTGFHLDQSELASIAARSVLLSATAQADRAADIVLADANLDAPGFATTGGSLALAVTGGDQTGPAAGRILVNGNFHLGGLPSDFMLSLRAVAIDIDALTGSLHLSDLQGQPTALLQVDTLALRAASPTILATAFSPSSAPSLARALASPLDLGRNAIVAGSLAGTISSAFLVQNTGSSDKPLGLLVRSGALAGLDHGSAPPLVLISGPQVQGSNLSLHDDLRQTSTGLVASLNSANGCLLVLTSCNAQPILAQEQSVQALVQAQAQFAAFPALASEQVTASPLQQALYGVADDPTIITQEYDTATHAQAEQAREAVASAPISPPTPVIDFGAVVAVEPVRTLVTGSGNPALIASDALSEP